MIVDIILGAGLAAVFIALVRRVPKFEMPLLGAGLVVAAVAYDLFTWLPGNTATIVTPLWSTAAFCLLAALGITRSTWFLAAGWLLHGLWDFVIPGLADVSHMPGWYKGLCVGFDLVAGGYLVARALGKWAPSSSDAASFEAGGVAERSS